MDSSESPDGSKDNYGLGWGTVNKEGVRGVGHSGGQQGTSTYFIMDSEHRAGVVVLTNMDSLDPDQLAMEIMKVLIAKSNPAK